MGSPIPWRAEVGLLVLALVTSTLGLAAEGADRRPELGSMASRQGHGWISPQNVSASPETDSETPALAVAGNGAIHLVWEEGDGLYHSYGTERSWSEPEHIPGTGDGEQPALAGAPDNTVHLVYVNDLDIFHVSWDTSSWSIPENVSDTDQPSDSPDIAIGSDGTLHVAATETAAKRLYYGKLAPGSSWTYVPITHDLGFAYGEAATIEAMTDGAVSLAFKDEDQEIYATRWSGTDWSVPENVSDSLDATSIAPDLAVDGNGKAHLVWQEDVEGVPQIHYAQGEDWRPIATLSSSPLGARFPALTIAGRERQHVLWDDDDIPFAILHASRSSSTGGWMSSSTVYTSSLPLDEVAVASGPDHTLHAAWVEGITGEVLYARRAPQRIYLPLVLTNTQQ